MTLDDILQTARYKAEFMRNKIALMKAEGWSTEAVRRCERELAGRERILTQLEAMVKRQQAEMVLAAAPDYRRREEATHE